MEEKTLILIKPDGMIKKLVGNIISDLYNLNLKMIRLKLVNVKKELAEKHYKEHKRKPFFEKLIKHHRKIPRLRKCYRNCFIEERIQFLRLEN